MSENIQPDSSKKTPPRVLTRIYIEPSGDLIVTDLWEEALELLKEKGGFSVEDESF